MPRYFTTGHVLLDCRTFGPFRHVTFMPPGTGGELFAGTKTTLASFFLFGPPFGPCAAACGTSSSPMAAAARRPLKHVFMATISPAVRDGPLPNQKIIDKSRTIQVLSRHCFLRA